MAEELSSPNHYVACTGDYDCAADEHIEGCGIVDKRAADEHGQEVNDAAVVDFIKRHHCGYFYADFGDCNYYHEHDITSGYVSVGYGPGVKPRRIPLDG